MKKIKYVKYENCVNYVFWKLFKNWIYVTIENYVKYGKPYNERREIWCKPREIVLVLAAVIITGISGR